MFQHYVPRCRLIVGEVYLVFRNETRRFPLPDRSALTQLTAVRRMFLECFPDRLTPAWFDNCYNRVYVLDHASRHFYELEDIRYLLVVENRRQRYTANKRKGQKCNEQH